jgi:hypothetical protein
MAAPGTERRRSWNDRNGLIFHEALHRDPVQRVAYLRDASGNAAGFAHKETADLRVPDEPGPG